LSVEHLNDLGANQLLGRHMEPVGVALDGVEQPGSWVAESRTRRCGGLPCGRVFTGLCGTSDRGIGWGYVKQVEIVVMTARVVGSGLRPSKGSGVDEEMVMSQQAMRQAARRSALDAEAVLRKERADRTA
jgi:hypothetical protein